MKNVYLLFVIFVFPTNAFAQSDTITHIIERGESIEYLAQKYGVAETDIRSCNGSDFDLFYTGMEIRIPMPKRSQMAATSPISSYGSYYASKCGQADDLLNGGDNKKAIKLYTELIKSYSSSQPCTEAYYGRALAYYNRGKWKNAIRDFETVIDDTGLSESARSQCKDLLAKARENREAQIEERGQMWAGLIGAAAMTTAAVISAKQQAKAANVNGGTYGNRGTFSSVDVSSTNSESIGSSNRNSSGKVCRSCKGDGKCIGCHGSGYRTDNQFGTGVDYSHKCGVCGGNGICSVCNGIGYK